MHSSSWMLFCNASDFWLLAELPRCSECCTHQHPQLHHVRVLRALSRHFCPAELHARSNIEVTRNAVEPRDQSDDRQRINGSRNSIYRVIISARGVLRPRFAATSERRGRNSLSASAGVRPRTQHANRLVRSHASLFLGLIHAPCHSSSENIDPSCPNLVLPAYAGHRSLSTALKFSRWIVKGVRHQTFAMNVHW